jgi:hypothetical protein
LTLGVWLYLRQSRRPAEAPAGAPVAGHQPQPRRAAPPARFPCPGCGKDLKARADLAGKKVKCPQCGQAVTVPGTAAGEAGGSSP